MPMDYYPIFSETVAADLADTEGHKKRMGLLLPIYRVKWCCILLNDFLPVGKSRRRFAERIGNHEDKKAVQLKKARNALESLKEAKNIF